MPTPLVECAFYIPLARDEIASDGKPHPSAAWKWLEDGLFQAFSAYLATPGLFEAVSTDPDAKQRVDDRSRKYVVALNEKQVGLLRELLQQAADRFRQKSIYLCVAGRVEFVAGTF